MRIWSARQCVPSGARAVTDCFRMVCRTGIPRCANNFRAPGALRHRANPAQIVTTCGVTQGVTWLRVTSSRRRYSAGRDPAWFVMFARLAAFGAKLVAVPRGPMAPI